jgi:cysteinyl-tRNA synthetase
MNLTWDALTAADRRLRRWRTRVAEWAEQPSAAMSADYVHRLGDAFDDDLDTPTALVALGELERDAAVPVGSKFETFVWVDRMLGLDLARDVGKPRDEVGALPDGAAELLNRRAAARAAKDFGAADALREELAGLGVAVTDTQDGQSWVVAPN